MTLAKIKVCIGWLHENYILVGGFPFGENKMKNRWEELYWEDFF